jgi:NADH-quinone oxidoreductase subunit M
MADYGGIWKAMPVLGAISLVITLSSMGLPGLNGFIGEFTILMGSMGSSYLGFFFTLFATLGVILAAVYLLKMFQHVFMGEFKNPLKNEDGYKLTWNELAALIPILIMIFWIGIQPIIFFNTLDVSVDKIASIFVR